MITIDGSYGEGGGQILRSAISLSAITRNPVEIINIRKGRNNNGLRPQHFSSIKAASSICNAKVSNFEIGSTKIVFSPNQITTNQIEIDIGTAGSITLLLQTIIPIVVFNNNFFKIKIIGGTDVKWSPTIDYFRYIIVKAFSVIGINVEIEVIKRGYYPKGGGIIEAIIKTSKLKPFVINKNINDKSVEIKSVVSNLPKSIANKQANSASQILKSKGYKINSMISEESESNSPGSSIIIYSSNNKNNQFVGYDKIGERGKSSEIIGKEAAIGFINENISQTPVDSHLGDMLIPILSLIPYQSSYMVSKITSHIETNLFISKLITGCNFSVKKHDNGSALINIKGETSYSDNFSIV